LTLLSSRKFPHVSNKKDCRLFSCLFHKVLPWVLVKWTQVCSVFLREQQLKKSILFSVATWTPFPLPFHMPWIRTGMLVPERLSFRATLHSRRFLSLAEELPSTRGGGCSETPEQLYPTVPSSHQKHTEWLSTHGKMVHCTVR
jgi:hypothetical protein